MNWRLISADVTSTRCQLQTEYFKSCRNNFKLIRSYVWEMQGEAEDCKILGIFENTGARQFL